MVSGFFLAWCCQANGTFFMMADFPQSAKEEAARLSESLSQIKGEKAIPEGIVHRWVSSDSQLQRCLDIFLWSSKRAVWACAW